MEYGNPPIDLGLVDIKPKEMMFYLYLPVLIPGQALAVPKRLEFLYPLLDRVFYDNFWSFAAESHWDYMYVTAKTLHVGGGSPGNRPGWHADGFGSGGDLNYIWHDMNPTEFAIQEFLDIPDDDLGTIAELERQVSERNILTYPNRHLLRLDESVVHRVNPLVEEGTRTFIKVSLSRHRYNLSGNSHNHLLDYDWEMHDRTEIRNLDNKDFKL